MVDKIFCLPVVLPDPATAGISLHMERHCVLFHTRNIALEPRERAFCYEFLVKFDQFCARLFSCRSSRFVLVRGMCVACASSRNDGAAAHAQARTARKARP